LERGVGGSKWEERGGGGKEIYGYEYVVKGLMPWKPSKRRGLKGIGKKIKERGVLISCQEEITRFLRK